MAGKNPSTPSDFFLLAYLKNDVYGNKPNSVDELKMEIEVQIPATEKNTYACLKIW